MTDLEKVLEFMDSIHNDIKHEGEVVSVKGRFLVQQLEGVAKISGGEYQFVIEGARALVAVIDFEFEADEHKSYTLTGTLSPSGEFGLFPGIKADKICPA